MQRGFRRRENEIETLDPACSSLPAPVSTEDVASCREAYLESIADYNRKLENPSEHTARTLSVA
jgi:hypothetical protein